ncbi:hypothetical protein SSCG_00895 [Streptomyces clavuligerus]|nr:hypothetical protein SSCG_00895 [Streptomyces clavuligerus]
MCRVRGCRGHGGVVNVADAAPCGAVQRSVPGFMCRETACGTA